MTLCRCTCWHGERVKEEGEGGEADASAGDVNSFMRGPHHQRNHSRSSGTAGARGSPFYEPFSPPVPAAAQPFLVPYIICAWSRHRVPENTHWCYTAYKHQFSTIAYHLWLIFLSFGTNVMLHHVPEVSWVQLWSGQLRQGCLHGSSIAPHSKHPPGTQFLRHTRSPSLPAAALKRTTVAPHIGYSHVLRHKLRVLTYLARQPLCTSLH